MHVEVRLGRVNCNCPLHGFEIDIAYVGSTKFFYSLPSAVGLWIASLSYPSGPKNASECIHYWGGFGSLKLQFRLSGTHRIQKGYQNWLTLISNMLARATWQKDNPSVGWIYYGYWCRHRHRLFQGPPHSF